MTAAPADRATGPSPWLTVWLRPRDTIGRILAGDPRRHVLMLAAIGGIAYLVPQLYALGLSAELAEWRFAAGLAVVGALFGIVTVYLNGLLFRWSGRLFGGRASQAQLRAVLAWSLLPTILGLVLGIAAAVWFRYFADEAGRAPLLPVLTAVMGFLTLWTVAIILLMLARAQGFGFWRTIASAAVAWCLMLAAAVLIRTFLFQPFYIPSGAEMPTMLIGDYFFVAKYPYGYTHYSVPFSPRLFSGRILATEPQRGDLVVFRLPRDDTTDYIKRIVGLPGDRIQMRDGELVINGSAVKRERIEDFADRQDGRIVPVRRWRETLPNGPSYETLDLVDNGYLDNTQEFACRPATIS